MPIGTVTGAGPGVQLGFAVAAHADVTGDGVREILMGQPGAGSVIVYDGRSVAGTLAMPPTPAIVVQIISAPLASASFGAAVDGIGDITGDGFSDVIVGAPGIGSAGQAGFVFVMDGNIPNHSVSSWAGPASSTIPWGDVVANVGDLNNDSVDDMAFRSSVDSGNGVWVHSVHVIDGYSRQIMYGNPLQSPAGISQFGLAIVGTPDMDGDGTRDLAIGGSRLTLYSGQTGTVLGTSGSQRADAITVLDDVSPVPDGIVDLALGQPGIGGGMGQVVVMDGASVVAMLPTVLFQVSGQAALDRFGFSLATVDDVDGDGVSEVLVGAPQAGMSGGYAELVSGKDGCRLGRFIGGAGSRFGFDVSAFDDLDGDSRGDLIIGAPMTLGAAGAFWIYSHMWVGAPIGTSFCGCTNASCGNISSAGGCANSASASGGPGALLQAYGTTSLAADDLFFQVTNLPPNVYCLPFYSGAMQAAPLLFGDGNRCILSPISRLNPSLQASATGTLTFGPCITGSLVGATAGSSLSFQVWYRDPLGPCSSGFNLSNGTTILLAP